MVNDICKSTSLLAHRKRKAAFRALRGLNPVPRTRNPIATGSGVSCKLEEQGKSWVVHLYFVRLDYGARTKFAGNEKPRLFRRGRMSQGNISEKETPNTSSVFAIRLNV